MLKIRYLFMVLSMLLSGILSPTASADVSLNIGINVPSYPQLVLVPGYPVYYAPQLQANMFFYDGVYWIYQNDYWYESTWYNGPWWLVDPEDVPSFVLRVPVGYYRQPPVYFRGWQADAPPRWGDHWGHDWQQHRDGWDRWDHNRARQPAPPPVYQRQYSGNRYPQQVTQQQQLNRQNYHYQPRDPVVQQHNPAQQHDPAQQRSAAAPLTIGQQHNIVPQQNQAKVAPNATVQQRAPAQQAKPSAPEDRGRQQDSQRPAQQQYNNPAAPAAPVPQQQRPLAAPQQQRPQAAPQQQRTQAHDPGQRPEADQREQQRTQSQQDRPQGNDANHDQQQDRGQEQGHDRNGQ
jgi:hypothetical protein